MGRYVDRSIGGNGLPYPLVGRSVADRRGSSSGAIYSILEILGGSIAAGLFYIVRDDQFHDEIDIALKKDTESYGATGNSDGSNA